MLLMAFTTTGRCQPTSRLSPTEVPDRCSATPPPQLAAGGIVAALTHWRLDWERVGHVMAHAELEMTSSRRALRAQLRGEH